MDHGPFVAIRCGDVLMGGVWREQDGELIERMDEKLSDGLDGTQEAKTSVKLNGKGSEEVVDKLSSEPDQGPPILRLQIKRLAAGDEVRLWSDRGSGNSSSVRRLRKKISTGLD
jgi:hypothetical protein